MNLQETLRTESQALGIIITQEQADKFQQYFSLLVSWNEKVNLTSITEPMQVARKHFLDSLLLSKDIDFTNIDTLIDVGTGAGFPGLPLKILMPHLKLTLLDSLQKRCRFLEEVAHTLALDNVSVIHARAEEAAHDKELRERFDLATARAVANLRVISEYCLPFVKKEGVFIAPKGIDGEREASEAKAALKLLGGKIERVNTYLLPEDAGTRINIVIRKIDQTNIKYPRRAGLPEKKPL